jgi:hypothetical protein
MYAILRSQRLEVLLAKAACLHPHAKARQCQLLVWPNITSSSARVDTLSYIPRRGSYGKGMGKVWMRNAETYHFHKTKA